MLSVAALADIFSGLALDLSSSAEKLVKMCGPSVIANDEGIQRAGRAAILALAKLCPQQHAAKTLLTYQLGVLAGSEGKLASTSQKLSIIATIREVFFIFDIFEHYSSSYDRLLSYTRLYV